VLGNLGWLVGERFVTLLTGFFVNVWFVRHLGPEQYGLYSYAVNFAALFGLIASLGLDVLIVREVARAPNVDGETLGTALVLRGIAASMSWVAAVAAVLALRSDGLSRSMVGVLSAGSLAVAAGVFDLWFQAHIAARGVVIARTVVVILAATVRCVLILANAPLLTFAALLFASNVATAAAAYWLYRRARAPASRLSVNWARARGLLREGWPLIISSVSVIVCLKVDQVMLVAMAGDRENGLYAVAVTLSEAWFFLPSALATTIFPLILRAHDGPDPALFESRMQLFYDGMAALGYGIAIPVALVAGPLIQFLYGTQYARSAHILSVHVVSFLFVGLGIARGRFLLAEDLTCFAMVNGVFAAILNVALNLLWIPKMGALGAAWSTLVSYAVANYFTGFLHPLVRRQAWLMTRSFFVPFRPGGLVKMLHP
jgi:PST family polysaccharide transporter